MSLRDSRRCGLYYRLRLANSVMAYSSPTWLPSTRTVSLLLLPQVEVYLFFVELYWNIILSSKPNEDNEDGFYSLENKRSIRTMRDQGRLFRRTGYEKGAPTSQKYALSSSPGEDSFVARKPNTTEERRKEQSCLLRRGGIRTRKTTAKICPGFEFCWWLWLGN